MSIGNDEEELLATMAHWDARPEQVEALRRQNACAALRSFHCAHPSKEMLRLAGLSPSPRLREREERLTKLAALA